MPYQYANVSRVKRMFSKKNNRVKSFREKNQWKPVVTLPSRWQADYQRETQNQKRPGGIFPAKTFDILAFFAIFNEAILKRIHFNL